MWGIGVTNLTMFFRRWWNNFGTLVGKTIKCSEFSELVFRNIEDNSESSADNRGTVCELSEGIFRGP